MIAIIASFFSLFVGPLVYQTFGPLKRTDKIANGIVLVVVGGTVIFQVIPESYQLIGVFAVVLGIFGFVGPTVIERAFHRAADTTHKLTILLGLAGLVVHAFLDGVAIQASESGEANNLSLAIVLHRLPVGLTIWWLLKPLLGERYALLTLLMMGVASIAGFALGQSVIEYQNNQYLAAMQSFIAGSLLHVVIHKPHADGCMHTSDEHQLHHHKQTNKSKSYQLMSWENLGMLLGVLILIGLNAYHH